MVLEARDAHEILYEAVFWKMMLFLEPVFSLVSKMSAQEPRMAAPP